MVRHFLLVHGDLFSGLVLLPKYFQISAFHTTWSAVEHLKNKGLCQHFLKSILFTRKFLENEPYALRMSEKKRSLMKSSLIDRFHRYERYSLLLRNLVFFKCFLDPRHNLTRTRRLPYVYFYAWQPHSGRILSLSNVSVPAELRQQLRRTSRWQTLVTGIVKRFHSTLKYETTSFIYVT